MERQRKRENQRMGGNNRETHAWIEKEIDSQRDR
jgi:hypothetical protein